jgi:protocatechuate 3,4-dioxygenase beta subunit
MGERPAVNERLVEIWDAITSAVRDVVDELRITEDEIHLGSRFLQRVGEERCLVGLIDMCLATAAADRAARDRGVLMANVEGPLYLAGAPRRDDGVIIERELEADAPLLDVTGRVYDTRTGEPIAGAELDFWQTDHHGVYDTTGYHMRGVLLSAEDGTYELHTVLPRPYTLHEDDLLADLFAMLGGHPYRSAHIHLKVRVDGTEVLTTQFYDSESPFLEDDCVIGAVRPELVIERQVAESGEGRQRFRMTFDVPITRPELG